MAGLRVWLDGGLGLACGVAVIGGSWSLAAPLPTAPVAAPGRAESPPDLSILHRFPAFSPAPAVEAASGDVAAYQLYAVRVDDQGGSAIIAAADGKQAPFVVGEAIDAAAKLHSVADDHAIISVGGSLRRLDFARATSRPSGPGAAAGQVAEVTGQRASGVVAPYASALRPHKIEGRVRGYLLRPGSEAGVLASAGLQAGDVITRLNGMEFTDAERVQELADEVAMGRPVQIEYMRSGAARQATLNATINPN